MNLLGQVHVSRKVILSELQKSLMMLGVSYIDIYLLHRDDPKTPVSEIVDTLNECRNQGKIRIFGVSNWTHERYHTTVPDIALRYIFGSDMNVYAVLTSTNPERMAANAASASKPLSKEDIRFLESG